MIEPLIGLLKFPDDLINVEATAKIKEESLDRLGWIGKNLHIFKERPDILDSEVDRCLYPPIVINSRSKKDEN